MTIIQIIGFLEQRNKEKKKSQLPKEWYEKNPRTERHDFPGWASRWVKSTTDKEKFLKFSKDKGKKSRSLIICPGIRMAQKVLKAIVEARKQRQRGFSFEEKGFST